MSLETSNSIGKRYSSGFNMRLQAIGLDNLPLIKKGDDLAEMIFEAARAKGIAFEDGDIIVVTEKIVSKAEGRLVELNKVKPSKKASELGKLTEKDPRLVELILRESKEILALGKNFIVVETKHGFVMANAGIDQSNVEDGKAKLLPRNPDKSAEEIRRRLEERSRKKLGVVIADSWGRTFRYGSVGVAIGSSGIVALWDRRGEKDLFGRELKVTRVAVADCLASLASLILGEGRENIPVVVIKGLSFAGEGKARDLLRDRKLDVFRKLLKKRIK